MKHIISLKKAAKTWEGGLPIGNGRLGATVLGKIQEEWITINEETIWYGPFRNRKNPDCKEHIEEIRKLLLEGEVQKAQFLAKMAMTSTPKYMNPYQPAGDLKINFMGHMAKRTGNRRTYLDLDDAIAYVTYDMEGVHYERHHLVSEKYQVVAIHLTASEPGTLTISANMNRKPFEENSEKIDHKTVCNYGQNGAGGVSYFTGVRMSAKGAKVQTMGDFVYTENADEVTIYAASGTDFADADYKEKILKQLDEAEKAGFEKIREEHLKTYHMLYDRVEFSLNEDREDTRITEEQLEEIRNGEAEDNDYLVSLLFHFAKYLMISSSYNCLLPANLQGIWNGEYVPPWQSEFTININTEMNYWFVEKANLPECHEPLFSHLERMVENGRETAKNLYGCRGFCAHHNTNLWANTDPEGIMDASPFWPMGGAWLSLHMYEHYLFTRDKEFLKERALPVMREAITFFEDYLYEMEDGTLVTGPSVSPENAYLSKIGIKGALCMGPAMDIQILRQLFSWYLEGTEIVGLKEDKIVKEMLEKLPPTRISSDGRVMEWQEEYEEPEPGHRHISHMYGLHPGNEISETKPELFEAAKKTIEKRLEGGGGHTGWSRAWIICFFARLKNSEKFYENLLGLLKKSIKNNMYDTHPPFQIDGNFGVAEGIMEAIVQSHNPYIDLLPALPKQWKKGRLSGVRLRGGITAEIIWEEGKLKEAYFTADEEREVSVKYGDVMCKVLLPKGIKTKINV